MLSQFPHWETFRGSLHINKVEEHVLGMGTVMFLDRGVQKMVNTNH
jgi:hypothetical protein